MQSEPRRLELSVTQVAASALAAVSAAFASSYLGVAGTLLGAAAGSIIATIATAIYVHSMRRTNERLRAVVLPAVAPRMHPTGATRQAATLPVAETALVAPMDVTEDVLLPADPRVTSPGPIRWKAVAAAAGLVFLVAVGAITAIEVAAGESLPSMVGRSSSGTTVGGVVNPGGGGGPKETPPASHAPGGAGTSTPTMSQTPSESSDSTPTPTPTETAPSPTDTGVPSESPPASNAAQPSAAATAP